MSNHNIQLNNIYIEYVSEMIEVFYILICDHKFELWKYDYVQ